MSSSNGYGTTTSVARQKDNLLDPQADEVVFLSLLDHINTTGAMPENYGNIGRFNEYIDPLNEVLNQDGIEGFRNHAKPYIFKRETRLAKIYATHEFDQAPSAEQGELHPDFRIGKKGKKVFKTYSEDDIEALPDPESMIAGTLQAATVSILAGQSNVGKTFVALDIAEHTARGMDWIGRSVKQGNVLYIYAESRLGLKPRIMAWKKHHNLPSTPNLAFIPRPVQLIDEREFLLDTIAEQEVAPSLVVIDTFSNCAVGINQNDQMDVYRVLATAHEIVREYGCHVMIVHHTNKSDGVNGSAAFKNHVDTMIRLDRADKNAPVIMHCEKQRDAAQFDDITLQLEVVDLHINQDTLETVTSCVVAPCNAPAQEDVPSQTEQKMLDVLTLLGRTSYNSWKKACEDAKVVKPTSFYTYVQKMVDQHRVCKDSEGRGRKTWYEAVKPTSSTSSEVPTSSDARSEISTSSTSSELVQTELVEVGTN